MVMSRTSPARYYHSDEAYLTCARWVGAFSLTIATLSLSGCYDVAQLMALPIVLAVKTAGRPRSNAASSVGYTTDIEYVRNCVRVGLLSSTSFIGVFEAAERQGANMVFISKEDFDSAWYERAAFKGQAYRCAKNRQ